MLWLKLVKSIYKRLRMPPNRLQFSYNVQECIRVLLQMNYDFLELRVCGQIFEQFKTLATNSRLT